MSYAMFSMGQLELMSLPGTTGAEQQQQSLLEAGAHAGVGVGKWAGINWPSPRDLDFHISGDALLRMFRVWQVIMMGHAVLFLACFFTQIHVEKYQRSKITSENVKYQLHRMGLFASFILFAYSFDPFTINGLFTELIAYELSVTLTACLVACVVVLNHATYLVVKRSKFEPASSVVKYFSVFIVIVTFGVAVVSIYLAYQNNDMYFTGFNFVWLGTVFLLMITWFLWNTWTILKYLESAAEKQEEQLARGRSSSGGHRREPSSAEVASKKHQKKVKEMRWRMWMVAFLALIFIPAQYATGVKRVLAGRNAKPFKFVDDDHGEPKDFFLLTGQLLAMWAVLWYGWVKVRFQKPKQPWEDEERAASGSISSARRTSKQNSSRRLTREDSEYSVGRTDTEQLMEIEQPVMPDEEV